MPRRTTYPTGAPCWVDLYTSDVEASRRFYTELLGWTAEDPNQQFGGYLNFVKDGVGVWLLPTRRRRSRARSRTVPR